jgi:hypothetical protein
MDRMSAFIFDSKGPALIGVAMRESTTAPNRIKVALGLEITAEIHVVAEGEEIPVPAQAVGHSMKLAEFRLEMN